MDADFDRAGRAARLVVPDAAGLPLLDAVADRLTGATGRLALVTAPGGYGKTTQVARWAASDGRTVAWADLEAGDNDPVVLLSVLVELLSEVEGFEPWRIPSVRVAPEDFTTAVLPAFGRVVQQCETPFILVLDEVHVIDARPAAELLAVLTWAVPAHSVVVLVGRAAPSASFARLRAHRGIVDVSAAQLALDVTGAGQLLEGMGVRVDAAKLAQLVQDTEGWPVGLRLAAAALRDEPDQTAVLTDGFCVGDHDVARYMHEEWLRGLSEADVNFLMQVAILDWLSAPVCDHVLGRPGAGTTLRRLHSSRLLVMPLDRRQESYRMHQLLHDALEAELALIDPNLVRRNHSRASEWFESTGDIDRAVHHALRAGDVARGETLVAEHTGRFHTTGHYATVARWLDAFPERHVTSSPSLCLMAAVTASGMADAPGTMAWLRFADNAQATSPDPDPLTGLQLDAFRSLMSSTSAGAALLDVRRAYQSLPPGIWHVVAAVTHGELSFALGDDETATALFIEAAAEAQITGATALEATSRANLAVVHGWAGDWAGAVQLARAARDLLRQHRLERMPTQVVVTAMGALAEAMSGRPEAAHADWQLTRHNLASYPGVAACRTVQSYLALARTSLLLNDRANARSLLDEAASRLERQADAVRPTAQLAALREMVRAAHEAASWGRPTFTKAELRVLHYLPTNLTLPQIASQIYISHNTAKTHVTSIYRKLGTTSRGEAVELARAAGMLMTNDLNASSQLANMRTDPR